MTKVLVFADDTAVDEKLVSLSILAADVRNGKAIIFKNRFGTKSECAVEELLKETELKHNDQVNRDADNSTASCGYAFCGGN